jgi:hypothetical protein
VSWSNDSCQTCGQAADLTIDRDAFRRQRALLGGVAEEPQERR